MERYHMEPVQSDPYSTKIDRDHVRVCVCQWREKLSGQRSKSFI